MQALKQHLSSLKVVVSIRAAVGKKVKLVFAAGFGDYSHRKGEFQTPESTLHQAKHSLEEKYLWFSLTKGRAVATPPV